jgi:hypothetical protein
MVITMRRRNIAVANLGERGVSLKNEHSLPAGNAAPQPLHKTACHDDSSCEGLYVQSDCRDGVALIYDRTALYLAFTAFIISSTDSLVAVVIFEAIHLSFSVKLITSPGR